MGNKKITQSKTPEYIPYYKIIYGRKASWTLKQVVYLSVGQDPDHPDHLIDTDNGLNTVSKRYVWLKTKQKQGYIHPISGDETKYNSGSLLRILEERYENNCDPDIRVALNHMSESPYYKPIRSSRVTKSIFRRAGEIVFKKYPNATIKQVAIFLENLPTYYNSTDTAHLDDRTSEQIAAFLKNANPKADFQKPKATDKPVITITYNEVIDLM